VVRLVPNTLRRRPRPETDDHASVEDYVGGATGFRRRLTVTAIGAVTAVVAVSVGLAFAQYRHAQRSNVNDLRSRAVVAAGLVDAAFSGDISTLDAVATAPSFANLDRPTMGEYLRRLRRSEAGAFNGGIAWIDSSGFVEVSSAGGATVWKDVSDRTYFRRVMATGRPYVSGGLIGRSSHEPVVVVAVPTRLASGRISGVLSGGIRLDTVRGSRTQLALGYAGLQILDRNGRNLLQRLTRPENAALVARLSQGASGSLAGTRGLDGSGSHVVAYATATVPGWRIVIDRPRSAVDASAFRSLVLQLVSVAAVALLVVALVWLVVRRSRRDHELQESRARAWRDLIRALGAAATPDEVTSALIASLSEAFPDALVVVILETLDGGRETRASTGAAWSRLVAADEVMAEIAARATSRRGSIVLDRTPLLRPAVALSSRRLRSLHTVPLHGVEGDTIGGVALLRGTEEPLDAGEWALFNSFAEQAARALERSRRSELDHDLAVRLQLSLLPETLPDVQGVTLAGHYRAGAEGLVVGGDWYDAVRRRDGVLVLCVGDVIGRGIAAATLMGRLRDAFRAHAYETGSPAEVVRRLLQHESGHEIVTVACASFDPYSGELAYSCAGHPPPLLVDEETGSVVRLDGAAAPPLGVADEASIQEERLVAPERATLVLYTDGLIERRGESIDRGIDVLGEVVAAEPSRPIARILAEVTDVLGPGTDDVAFLVVRVGGAPAPFEVELPARPSELSPLRRRLRAWLARLRFEPAEADEILLAVSEACNNAIEHAYGDEVGTVRLRLEVDGDTLRATIRDRGRWRGGESDADRGRGTAIMRAVMDRAEIATGDEGTEVLLERRRRTAGPAPAVR
jgi:serine phosphatase RsbU (regulator of sigma subunit)/anti-sigma regulatory factor (Ser/Thr protein kinase)